eukprot:352715-Chlamydomonas_euryale.AAC.6
MSGVHGRSSLEVGRVLALARLLAQQHRVDFGQHATGGQGQGTGAQQLGQLLVVADNALDVAGDDAFLLCVARGAAGQLQHFRGEVLHDSGQVDGRASADALGVLALLEVARHAADGEQQAGLARPADSLRVELATATWGSVCHEDGLDLLSENGGEGDGCAPLRGVGRGLATSGNGRFLAISAKSPERALDGHYRVAPADSSC